MDGWRVNLFGPLAVSRGGVPVRLRTRYQGLLLARLVVAEGMPVPRGEIAAALWAEAGRENALAYLRRAVQEIRAVGIEIGSDDEGLILDPSVVSDLGDGDANGGEILRGATHPYAETIRAIVRRQLAMRDGAFGDAIARAAPPGGDGTLEWLGAALVRTRPALALELVARHSDLRFHDNPPARMLALRLRILEANRPGDPLTLDDRLRVLVEASHDALLLTRMGQAEGLALAALEEARAADHAGGEAMALAALTGILRESGRWDLAAERGREALAAAERSGDGATVARARDDLASVLLHTAAFDEAAEQYRRSWEASAGTWVHRVAVTNLVHLWAVYGVALPFRPAPYAEAEGATETGYTGWVEGCLEFSTGFGRREAEVTARGMRRMLAVTAGEGMERLLCVALDSAAFGFARLDLPAEAAACVRVGTRVRVRIGHPRSPGERVAVRRHVAPPYFGPRIGGLVRSWDVDEIETMAARICARLPK